MDASTLATRNYLCLIGNMDEFTLNSESKSIIRNSYSKTYINSRIKDHTYIYILTFILYH